MAQQELMNKIAKAYELQETLKKERLQVRKHEEEYKELMSQIISSKVQRLGKYEIVDTEVNKKRQIISEKFRAKWPELFDRLATITLKAAREEIDDKDLEEICEIKKVMKPTIVIHNVSDN